MEIETVSATAFVIEDTKTLDLDMLRRMSFEELEALYRLGRKPSALSNLDGDADGAMLAWRFPRTGPFAWLLRVFGKSAIFPWSGKSFKSSGETGEGINRMNLLVAHRRWFPFTTHFGASFLDGKPTFVLDYSRPGNPPLIRQIVDEVREVARDLYMGPAALKVNGKPRLALFFAVSLQ
jgi:hypothetical protein